MKAAVERITLIPPNFSQSNFVGFKAGLRPCRKGGVRLDESIIRGRRVLHNYGHGAGGVSLAPGYANHRVQTFLEQYGQLSEIKTTPLGIIGCGYMGLFTALELVAKGFKVNIYADQFVKENGICSTETDADHPTASQIAGGYWLPYGYEYDINAETKRIHDKACSFSFNAYKEIIEKKTFKGVRFMKVYHLDNIDYVKNSVPKEIIGDFKEVQITWGNGKYYDANMFTTILIEGDILLKELYARCEKAGVQFIKKHLANE